MKQVVIIKKIKKDYQKQKEKIISKVLHKYYNINNYEIVYNENGKPYIKGNKVYFNISNARNKVIFVFNTIPVGVDIEYFRPIPHSFKQFLNLEKYNDKETITIFSEKEAIIKLLGKSLSFINDIKIEDYKMKVKIHKKYVICIAYHH